MSAVSISDAAHREISELFATAVDEHRTSGVTWAVVGGHDHPDSVLAHGADGYREMRDGAPTADSSPMARETISRICSMTKSFTAATILALRDEGAVRLDDPVADYVPEARSLTPAAADAPVITLRHLLMMNAGFVTDNPWGDRQQSITREQFAAELAGGLASVHLPGTGFEYSNTGYALLGRVIDEVTGEDFGAHMTRRILAPLGMASTGFALEEVDASRVATGHRVNERGDESRFEPLPFDAHGVYGAMAGLFSTVDDLAAWMRFLAAAGAPDSADRDQTVLSTASRREMQQLHNHQPTAPLPADDSGKSPGYGRIRGYGYGLVIERFPDLGEVISHSGGYPGYGSFMMWHRDTGVGAVALANSKYAPTAQLCYETLRIVQRHHPGLIAARKARLHPATEKAAEWALGWLRGNTSEQADAYFAMNMDLDIPRDERERRLESALETAGRDRSALAELTVTDATVMSPFQLRWTIAAASTDHRDARIELLMSPHAEPLIQALDVTNAHK